MPAPANARDRRTARTWDRFAKGYAKSAIRDVDAYERKLDMTRKRLHPDMQVLEFGCGTGSTALRHAPHVAHLHAIDISAKMLDIARQKARDRNVDNVRFEQATLDDLPDDAGPYDAVFGFSILHLLDDRDAALAEVHRRLRPGGQLFTSTPCLADTHGYLRWLLPPVALVGLVPSVRFFSCEALERSFAAAGFSIEQAWQPKSGAAVFHILTKGPAGRP